QLKWEAEVIEYVNLLWNATHSHSNKSTIVKTIGHDVPLLGLQFVPPIYFHTRLHPDLLNIKPEMQYLKPITIVHPLYYSKLAVCPQCQSHNEIIWERWTTMGAQEVHGIAHEKTTLRLQLCCDSCKERSSRKSETMSKENYCFAMMSHSFWKYWNYWDISGRSMKYYITVSPSWYLTQALR
ncbi:hypothetical protein HD554DRAFT_2027024, partial [Boletus coccyginus]